MEQHAGTAVDDKPYRGRSAWLAETEGLLQVVGEVLQHIDELGTRQLHIVLWWYAGGPVRLLLGVVCMRGALPMSINDSGHGVSVREWEGGVALALKRGKWWRVARFVRDLLYFQCRNTRATATSTAQPWIM